MSENQQENKYDSLDPFPGIPPALLNSADITKYAELGYLVVPFDRGGLKSAAYTMKFLGTLYRWESEGDRLKKVACPIRHGRTYSLPKNSITYLFTEEKFCLPEYIAARINFRIPFVHKGMLLGTGPLVDAGFKGSLLIPLHNLTNNDYSIDGGDPLIWVEFTKLSPHPDWKKDGERLDRPAQLVKFKRSKSNLLAADYLKKSDVTAKGGVQSAFKGALDEARLAANQAKLQTTRFTWSAVIGGVIGVVSLLLGVSALVFAAFDLNQSNNEMTTHLFQDHLSSGAQGVSPHPQLPTVDDVDGLRSQIDELTERVLELEDARSETSTPEP